MLDQLEEILPHEGDSTIYTLYGNLAYAQSIYLIGGFFNADAGKDEALYNQIMSSVRITVKWGFGAIIEKRKFLDFQQSIKIFECLVAQYYIIAGFLCNLRNCLVGSKPQSYFNAQQLTIVWLFFHCCCQVLHLLKPPRYFVVLVLSHPVQDTHFGVCSIKNKRTFKFLQKYPIHHFLPSSFDISMSGFPGRDLRKMMDENLIFVVSFMDDVCVDKFGVHSVVRPRIMSFSAWLYWIVA